MANDLDQLRPYLDAFDKGCSRTRAVLFVIVATTVVSVAYFLNNRPGSWAGERVRLAGAQYADLLAQTKSSNSHLVSEAHGILRGDLQNEGVFSADQLKASLTDLERDRQDMKTIHIPVFDVAIDGNDMGLVNGLGLLFLSFTLLYFLGRDRENLKLALNKARICELLGDGYDLVSSSLVFHVPPPHSLRYYKLTELPKFNAAGILTLLPFVSQLIIVLFDLSTLPTGISLARWQTVAIAGVESALLVFIGYTTVLSRAIMREVSQILTGAAGEL